MLPVSLLDPKSPSILDTYRYSFDLTITDDQYSFITSPSANVVPLTSMIQNVAVMSGFART